MLKCYSYVFEWNRDFLLILIEQLDYKLFEKCLQGKRKKEWKLFYIMIFLFIRTSARDRFVSSGVWPAGRGITLRLDVWWRVLYCNLHTFHAEGSLAFRKSISRTTSFLNKKISFFYFCVWKIHDFQSFEVLEFIAKFILRLVY